MDPKTTIVLLPGLNGTQGLFQPLIDCTPNHFNVMPVTYPTHQKLSYEQLKDLVEEKINHLDAPYIVVGESFSGPISLMLGQSKPQGLMGIVLVSTFIQAPNLRIGRFLPWTLGFHLTKPIYGLREALSKDHNKGFIALISEELQKSSPSVLADRIRSIFSVNAATALDNCDVPILYLRGTKDFVVPEKNLDLIIKIKPDVSVAYFDTQHFLLQSKPVQAWEEITRFHQRLTTIS